MQSQAPSAPTTVTTLYLAKRKNGKWLNTDDDDVKRFLEDGEVFPEMEEMMSSSNRVDPADQVGDPKYGLPDEADVQEGDCHAVAVSVTHVEASRVTSNRNRHSSSGTEQWERMLSLLLIISSVAAYFWQRHIDVAFYYVVIVLNLLLRVKTAEDINRPRSRPQVIASYVRHVRPPTLVQIKTTSD